MSQPIRLDQLSLAIVVVAIFAAMGHQRGILRELVATPFIILGPLLAPWLAVVLVPWVNRFYKLFMFARFGGLATDDFGAVMERVKQVPPLVCTPADLFRLGVVVCLAAIAAGYLLGQWRVKAPADRIARLLGAVIGTVNGYLLVRILVDQVWPTQFVAIVVPLGSVAQLFQAQTAAVLIVAFMAIVVLALQRAQKK